MPAGQEIVLQTAAGVKRYPSRTAAAKAFYLTESIVRGRIKKLGWSLEEAFGIEPATGRKPWRPIVVPTAEGERHFPSVRAAAIAFEMADSLVQRRLKSGWSARQALGLDPKPKRRSRAVTLSPEERGKRKRESNRRWVVKNREKLLAYKRQLHAAKMQDKNYREYHRSRTLSWRKNNRERSRELSKDQWKNMNDEQRARRKQNKRRQYHRDPEKSRSTQRQWRVENRDRATARQKAWLAKATPEQLEKIRDARRRWRQENRERRKELSKTPKAKETRRRYLRKKWREDPQHKLGLALRNRVNKVLAGRAKAGSAIKFLGCTIEELRSHLESLFLDGMGWDNWGLGPGTWQIDHIVALALHDLTDPEQLAIVCHWSNLMPRWHQDHARKTVADTVLIRRKQKAAKGK